MTKHVVHASGVSKGRARRWEGPGNGVRRMMSQVCVRPRERRALTLGTPTLALSGLPVLDRADAAA